MAPPAAKPRIVASPTLRSTPSLSNIYIHGHHSPFASMTNLAATPAVPATQPQNSINSSASSVSNLDTSEGILIQETEVEVDTNEEEALGSIDHPAGDDTSKKTLRDKLRRTLSENSDTTSMRTRQRGQELDVSDLQHDPGMRFSPRQYFVLTDAGKPVFTSLHASQDAGSITSTVGVMQALISVFLDDNDKLRCINAGNTRITFLIRSPLYFVCVSSWGEPESVTRSHLEYLHLQILSIVTASQLRRIFERHTNFDLRRLLEGAETFLRSLLTRLERDLALSTSSLHVLKLDINVRKQVADALIPPSKMKDILYVMLVAGGRIVTLIRPRKHSIHPADIHILLNTIHAPSILNSPASVSWIPVCLPKFNPTGFVNAYISFLRKDQDKHIANRDTEAERQTTLANNPSLNTISHDNSGQRFTPVVGLVCISGGGDFETIRKWCDSVTQKLETEDTLKAITGACDTGLTEYTASELGIPGLRHFVYKSRSQVQVTIPLFEDPYDDINEQRRLTTLYQIIHDAIHRKSGQEEMLKLQFIRTDKECVMGWITQPFELYVALSPRLPKSAVVGAANAVARWVKKEESRLFLKDAPVF